MSTSITPTATKIPEWPTTFEPSKSPFIIYNRVDGENDVRNFPNIVNIGTIIPNSGEYDRDAIVFDVVNRSVLRHKKGNYQDIILSGHTYYGGVHNEVFNDYKQNTALNECSYSFVAGIGNNVQYNTTVSSSGGAAFGHYNNAESSYLFTVGNGLNNNNRSNILTLTDESVIFGYSPRIGNGKYVTIKNGTVAIEGDLTVSGTINGEKSGGGSSSEELEKLKERVVTNENNISSLSNSVGTLQSDVITLKTEISTLKSAIETLSESLNNVLELLDLNSEN